MFKVEEKYRASHPLLKQDPSWGTAGFFVIPKADIPFENNDDIYCVVSDGRGWEHISVTVDAKRCPTWEEMCFVKDLFWDKEDMVIQYHPAKNDYVDDHPFCLHLWRPTGNVTIPSPPTNLVGIRKKYA